MKKTNILVWGFLCVILFACTHSKEEKLMKKTYYAINYDNKITENIVDSINYVKLIGIHGVQPTSISKILLNKEHYYVFDKYGSGLVMVFDNYGNFITTIGQRGNAENEYVKAWDFDITKKNVIVYDIAKGKINWYSLEGQFLKSQKTPMLFKGIKALENGDFIVAMSKEGGHKYEVCLLDTFLQIKKSFIKFENEAIDDKITENIFQKTDNSILYNRSINNNVYEFNKDGELVSNMYFDFWGNNVPKEQTYSYVNNKKMKKEYTYMYDCPLKIGGKYIFSIFSKGNKGALVYDTLKKKCKHIIWEKAQTQGSVYTSDFVLPLCVKDKNVYGWMDESVYQIIKDKENVPQDIVQHIVQGGIAIIIYKLRK